jgi:cell division protein FtsA
MSDPIVVGIDVGSNKICTLVARLEGEIDQRILGVGIEPSQGIKSGAVVDLAAASQSIARSIEKAERTSGLEITSAIVSLAGSQVSGINSRGVVAISGGVISQDDVWRALDGAQAVAIPHNREIVHVIQRGFSVDGQEGIQSPIGFSGYRLEVEAHIITAAAATMENLRQCVQAAGVDVSQFVLNPLAAGEVVLNKTERDMGVCVCDIGAGTTNLGIYINGDVWHTMVLPVGGNHITQDIAIGMHINPDQAEQVKKQYGYSIMSEVSEEDFFTLRAFGEDSPIQVSRRDLAHIIEARVDEIFQLVLQEIHRSGLNSLLPAGMVLTGGSSLMAGIRPVAARVLNMPVRIAKPENLLGLVDQLQSPAFSTSVGLLKWAELVNATSGTTSKSRNPFPGVHSPKWNDVKAFLKDFGKRMLP